MALLAQGFDPSGYIPDYSTVNRANQQFFQGQQQALATATQGLADYSKEQSDLAKKDKEIAAKIKGTISLLDSAKSIYPDFVGQIDSMKTQLSDPSISNLDKAGIASQVENTIGLFAKHGEDAMKQQLNAAQVKYYEGRAEGTIGGGQPSGLMQDVSLTNPDGSQTKYKLYFDKRTQKYIDPETSIPIGDINKWHKNEKGWEATDKSTSQNVAQPANQIAGAIDLGRGFKSTAFAGPALDKTTANEVTSGKMAAVNGNPAIGSSGIAYRGLESDLPTVASKSLPAGSVINVVSDLFPQGRNFQVAGTGPASSNVIDFFSTNKGDYDKLANQKIQSVSLVNRQAQGISDAANIAAQQTAPTSSQDQIAQMIASGAPRATAENVSQDAMATEPSNIETVVPTIGRAGGITTIPKQVQEARRNNAAIDAYRLDLKSMNQQIDPEMQQAINEAKKNNDYDSLSQYADLLKNRAKAARESLMRTEEAQASVTAKTKAEEAKAAPALQQAEIQGRSVENNFIDNINDAKNKALNVEAGALNIKPARYVQGFFNTEQARLADLLHTVKSHIGKANIELMRKSSPTGAALGGSTSDADMKMLQESFAPINPLGDPTDIIKDLNRVQTTILDMVHGDKQFRDNALKNGLIDVKEYNRINNLYPKPMDIVNASLNQSSLPAELLTPQQRLKFQNYKK